MPERARLERELSSLLQPRPYTRDSELAGEWKKERSWERAELSTPDQDKTQSVKVEALRFTGRLKEVALVFAGVHGTEQEGVAVATQLLDRLKVAAAKGRLPAYTTVVIKQLVGDGRHPTDDPTWTHKAAGNPSRRYVLVGTKPVEPNRNFPRPGATYQQVARITENNNTQPELFDEKGKALAGKLVVGRMIDETRILIQLIEQMRPVRAVSIHAHRLPGARGDGPGIFVDPRGGFDPSDRAKTVFGQRDDEFTRLLLCEGLSAAKTIIDDPKNKKITHPFWGNLANSAGKLAPRTSTVHYTSEQHPPGTSFGEWAPIDAKSGLRKGMLTITAELPRYLNGPTSVQAEIIRIQAEVLARHFLGLQ